MLRLFNLTRNSHQRVAASYILAFGVVALCVVTMFLCCHRLLDAQKQSAELVNISGRQRMLSQRIALASQRLVCATNAEERYEARKTLLAVRSRFEDSHRFLLQGNRTDASNGKLSPEIMDIYFAEDEALHSKVNRFVDQADRLLSTLPEDPEADQHAEELLALATGELLNELDQVVKQHEVESERAVISTLRWVSLLFVVTLIVLVFQAVYIFQPILNANKKIDKAANHDPLTELANRRCLAQQAQLALIEARSKSRSIGFMHLDLDRFKAVNDTLGHGAGDEVLRRVAKTLKSNLRPDQLIARIGGDEFAVLFPNVAHVGELVGPAERMIEQLEKPIDIADKRCSIGCSIGLAVSDPDERDYERVLMDADIALYEAKKNGRNQYQIITEELRGQFERKEQVTKDIRDGITKSEFVPFFQPQFNTATGEVIGVEALARWRRKDGVFEKNAEFIQIADEIGLLTEIDQQILRKSLSAFVQWRDAGYNVPRISLNFSMRELEELEFVEKLTATVSEFGLGPREVSIEVLESVFLDAENTMAASNINALSRIGFMVELDDFGTGHAAITSLLDLAVDRIKLDRTLIRDIENGGPGQTITRTLIHLAHELNIETLAEGVETQSQAKLLTGMGCTNHQGFLYARPMAGEELEAWIVKRKQKRHLPTVSG